MEVLNDSYAGARCGGGASVRWKGYGRECSVHVEVVNDSCAGARCGGGASARDGRGRAESAVYVLR